MGLGEMENGGSDRPKNCVYIRIHSIVMGGRLKPPHWDVKDPDAIRGAGACLAPLWRFERGQGIESAAMVWTGR
ncbi:hypothetical protein ASA01S_019_00560 [Aeromonas salmonicida subsp. masoucida NBRC 13784]|nr:hypothetical protein ASA01S_019_00560 [Aeromonas salmonicida subsp. masoucida NBRC 13784]